jgi:hypothetical protein
MEMKTVKSSQIHAIGYDPETKKLHITFLARDRVTPGATYEYDDITPEQHTALVGAESIGRHFGLHIKGNAAIKFRKI